MRIRSIALATLLASFSLTALAADTNSFDIFGRGNLKTATTTFTLDKNKDGIRARSTISYVSANAGTVVDDYKITADGNFLTGTTTKRDAAQTTYTTAKAHDALTISVVLDRQPTGRRDLKLQLPSFLVLIPDDPSIWQNLLDTAAAHPHPDNVFYFLIPTMDARNKDRVEAFTLNTGGDKTGTFDGKPVTLRHFALKFKDNATANLYTDSTGLLMQVEAPSLGVKQIRTGFIIDKER